MNNAVLLLGSNMGNSHQILQHAEELIKKKIGIVSKTSSTYRTLAWGKTDQPDFLNKAITVRTEKSAEEILAAILLIEKASGRIRAKKFGPRTLDIDIIFFNDEIISSPNLKVPHPEIANRRFVLIPLAEIDADRIHPSLKKSVSKLLIDSADTLDVYKI